MVEKIEKLFGDLLFSLQTARLYPEWHPEFKKAVEKAYVTVQEALSQTDELVIGIVGEELAFEKEIFFDLSKLAKPVILYLKELGIEKIIFNKGLLFWEVSRFIIFLTTPRNDLKTSAKDALAELGVKNISVGKITETKEDRAKREQGYLRLYEDSINNVTHSLEAILNQTDFSNLDLKATMKNTMETLVGNYQDFLNFATLKRYDIRTFSHILNVSILAMHFSSKLGFSKEDVLEIGTAALFHDIGKIQVSRKIITKAQELTGEETNIMRNHVIVGANLLLKYVDTLGILPVIVCFEHHLKYDLSGYPKTAVLQKPNIASMIVSICDVYDALSQRRSYKSDYPTEMIYDIMIKGKATSFDPELLDKFFKIVGVWPIGTIVQLNDKRVAVVRKENEDDMFFPNVEIVQSGGKKEIIDLSLQKANLKIERSLNPFKEGKEYLVFVNPVYAQKNLTSD